MESEILKFICANQGAVDVEDLMFNLFPGESTNEVISNQRKFFLYSSNGIQKVVARTSMRLCRTRDCPRLCGGLHVCKNYLFCGLCQYIQQGRQCSFSHDLNSDHNQRILKEYELECLSRDELCTLLLQSENTLLPSICHDYNNGDGEFGRCQSGNACARLHVCQRYLSHDCSCYRNHDFYSPQPLKALYDLRVPDNIIRSLRPVYANKEALRFFNRQSYAGIRSNDGLSLEQRYMYRERGRGWNRRPRGSWGNSGHRGSWGNGANFFQHQRTSSLSDIHNFYRLNEDEGEQRDASSPRSDAADSDVDSNRGHRRQWPKNSNPTSAIRERGGKQSNHHRLPRIRSTDDVTAGSSKPQKDKSDACMYFLKGYCKNGDRCSKSHDKMAYRWQVQEGDQWNTLADHETAEKDYCDSKNSYRMKEMEERTYGVEKSTQTETEQYPDNEKFQASPDVENLKSQARALQLENERLKLQLSSLQAQTQKTDEERNNLTQLKDAYTKLYEDYNELKEEKKKRESHMVEKELVNDLQQRLTAAEEALAVKQTKIDDMKQELFQKEKDLEQISVFQVQAELHCSDYLAERAAREKLHEEKERLAAQLEYVKKQNNRLQEEMDSLGRRSLSEMQIRHGTSGGNPHGAGASLVGRGPDWKHQGNIPEHACPKCNEILPDMDSLHIHIMDCIN